MKKATVSIISVTRDLRRSVGPCVEDLTGFGRCAETVISVDSLTGGTADVDGLNTVVRADTELIEFIRLFASYFCVGLTGMLCDSLTDEPADVDWLNVDVKAETELIEFIRSLAVAIGCPNTEGAAEWGFCCVGINAETELIEFIRLLADASLVVVLSSILDTRFENRCCLKFNQMVDLLRPTLPLF